MSRLQVLRAAECGGQGYVVCSQCGEPLLPGDAVYVQQHCTFCSAGCDADAAFELRYAGLLLAARLDKAGAA